MRSIPIKEAKDRLTELARRVEQGETIVVTRNGKPVLDLVPHRTSKTLDLDAVNRFKARHGVRAIVTRFGSDFDEPLPDDVLLRPLPNTP